MTMTALLYAQSELQEKYHNDCLTFFYDRHPNEEPVPEVPVAKKGQIGLSHHRP